MTFGDTSAREENLQGKGQPPALRAMIRGSANTYASMLNATLFPFLLYQHGLAMATRVALGGLQAATGVAQQGMTTSSQLAWRSTDVGGGSVQSDIQIAQQGTTTDLAADRAVGQDTEAGDETGGQGSQAARGNAETTGRAALQQNVEITGETAQEGGVETTERNTAGVEEAASDLSGPVSLSPETQNSVDELPTSPAPEVPDEPVAEEAVDETDRGGRETSSRAEGEGDEAYPGPSAPPVPSSPAQEGSVAAEDSPPVREESPIDKTATEELPPPPEVPEVELPPPPVPQNILDELPPPSASEVPSIVDESPPPPTPEAPDEPATQPARGEKPRVHVRRITLAARRRAEEMGVDLAEVEGTGKDGQITVDDVRRKAQEGQS